MEKRFKIKLETANALVIEDEMTGNFGISLYKDAQDESFLRALNEASYDLMQKLNQKKEEPEDNEGREKAARAAAEFLKALIDEEELTNECDRKRSSYSGTVVITDGDGRLFPTGQVISVHDGIASIESRNTMQATLANTMLGAFCFESFDEFQEYMESVDIEIREIKGV